MPPDPTTTTWDFSAAHNLLQSLSRSEDVASHHVRGYQSEAATQTLIQYDGASDTLPSGLGDFNKLWDFLGLERHVPAPSVPPFEAAAGSAAKHDPQDAYTSDGALYYPASSKKVSWRDDTDGYEIADTQPEDSPPSPLQGRTKKLSKKQRQKANRKARQELQQKSHAEQLDKSKASSDKSKDFESEDDTVTASARGAKHLQTLPSGIEAKDWVKTEKENLSSKTAKSAPPKTPIKQTAQPSDSATPKVNPSHKRSVTSSAQAAGEAVSKAPNLTTAAVPAVTGPTESINKKVGPKPADAAAIQKAVESVQDSLKKQWPVADPFTAHVKHASAKSKDIPASEGRVPNKTQPQIRPIPETQTPTRKRHVIAPLVHNSTIDRHWALLLKLIHNFPQDRATLVSPLQLSINRPQPSGIHVFVDASNILIGFHNQLKKDRNIPIDTRVPLVDLNFHALALLLERRRPVAKRVLAGSAPEIPAFEEAREVGYETCILDKVWKARELTERQRMYATRALRGMSNSQHGGANNGYSADSDSAGNGDAAGAASRHTQQPKWVEQAVDEILHLKILESIVDAPHQRAAPSATGSGSSVPTPPAPTMVLATGDAAEAEYSSGFMKMVERALRNGWNVEVVAWGQSVSWRYRKMEKANPKEGGWGERFRVVELDDYAEELFGQPVGAA